MDQPPPRPVIRIRGRSFMALVLTPEPPLDAWLEAFDAELVKSDSFFRDRPVILDLVAFDAAAAPGLEQLGAALAERRIRAIAAENAPHGAPADLPAPLDGGRATADQDIPEAAEPPAPPPVPRSLVVDETIRSGRQLVFAEGDVTVLGSIASGAEVMAGGSIHIYGSLRGRAVAGFGGNADARIICRRMEAELIAIDGFYMTADDMDASLIGGPAVARLEGDRVTLAPLA